MTEKVEDYFDELLRDVHAKPKTAADGWNRLVGMAEAILIDMKGAHDDDDKN